ncbi:MAG TPA: hypothetical protein VGE13_02430 [Candidatus Saccharimonadales bacterium]
MKKITKILIALFIVLGLSAFVAPLANADTSEPTQAAVEPPTCVGVDTEQGTGTCGDVDESSSYSKSSATSQVTAVNGVSINSTVTVLSYIKVNGISKADKAHAKRYVLKKRMRLWTSYYNTAGRKVWHWKWYNKGHVFYWHHRGWHDGPCDNDVVGLPKGPKAPPKGAVKIRGTVKIVKRFVFEAAAEAKADEKVATVAKAWCTTAAGYAYGEGRGSATAIATARVTMSGYVRVSLLASVKAKATGDLWAKLGATSRVDVRANLRADAFAQATSEASALAVCKDTPVYNTPDVTVNPVACVAPGQTRTVDIVVGNPNSVADTARLTYRGQTLEKSVAANGTITFSFPNQGAGTYSGNVLLVTAGKSKSFTVTVENCPELPSSFTEVEQPNDVLVNNSRTIRVRGTVPSGQTATLKATSIYGTIASGDKSQVVTGSFDILIHYTAPSEVPASKSDTVTVQLFSQSGKKDDEKAVTFEIRPAPVDPL